MTSTWKSFDHISSPFHPDQRIEPPWDLPDSEVVAWSFFYTELRALLFSELAVDNYGGRSFDRIQECLAPLFYIADYPYVLCLRIQYLDWIPACFDVWTPVTRWYELSFDSYRFCISAIWAIALFWRTIGGIHIREHVIRAFRAYRIRHIFVCFGFEPSWNFLHSIDFFVI